MEIEDVKVSFTTTEIELLLSALAYYEMSFIAEQPAHVLDAMLSMRARLLAAIKSVNPLAPNSDAPPDSDAP